jgi:hypothetical protein
MKSNNPFCLCSSRNEIHNSDEELVLHEQQLNRNLADYGIQRLQVKGDGNCLFYALAEGLIHEMKMDQYRFGSHLQTFGLSTDIRLTNFANRLRQICIEQWKLHEQFYSQFVDTQEISFLKEVKKFSKTGVSDSILGDIVPLTISNTFNIQILIFTSVSNLSRIDIKPTNHNNSTLAPQKIIYLAYNQFGVGHYDAAYPHI